MCMHPLQVGVFLCTLLYSTVQSTVVQYLYFKPRMSGGKHKSSGDVDGTAKKHQELEAQTKDEERLEEEVTEEPKRFTMQSMVRGFSFFEAALLVLRHGT